MTGRHRATELEQMFIREDNFEGRMRFRFHDRDIVFGINNDCVFINLLRLGSFDAGHNLLLFLTT